MLAMSAALRAHRGALALEMRRHVLEDILEHEVCVEARAFGHAEQWTRDYERLRSKNEVAQIVDSALLVALILGLVVVIVMRVRRQDVRWRRAAVVGLVCMVLSLCASLNQFPLHEFGYPTTDSYGSFLSQQLLQALLSALGSGGLLFVLMAGAETLYREALPNQISFGNLFRPRGLATKRFFMGEQIQMFKRYQQKRVVAFLHALIEYARPPRRRPASH